MPILQGEICNGVAYIEWARLSRPLPDSLFSICLGRRRKFLLENFPSVPETSNSPIGEEVKFIRSLGSTAVFLSPPDGHGRRSASAHSLGVFDSYATPVGPVEETVVDLAIRVQLQGVERTIFEPATALFSRASQIAKRSISMLSSAVFPVSKFANQMVQRVPELVRESYVTASSFRIEVDFKDEESDDS